MTEPSRKRSAQVQLLAISWNLGWPVAAGVMLGHWLDESLGSSPGATLLFGIGALAVSVQRMLVLGRDEAADRQRNDGERP